MYATINELTDRVDPRLLVEIADADGDGNPDTAVLEAALEDAQGVIDGMLSGRYTTPLVSVPDIVRRLSCDLALGHLFARRHDAAPPEQAARVAAAHDLLRAIAQGQVGLPEVASRDGGATTTQGVERIFDRDSLSAF